MKSVSQFLPSLGAGSVCSSTASVLWLPGQQGLLCKAVTHQFQEAMYLRNVQQKDLKVVFRLLFPLFLLVIYINCFFQQNGWGNSICC